MQQRSVAATKLNKVSSRSHGVCTITVKQYLQKEGKHCTKTSRINLVDLAGSERISKSGSDGSRFTEATHINQSLVVLGQVITALAEGSAGKGAVHIPYRDSILTWLLKENLGGNSRTIMLATISPDAANADETFATLRYSCRARRVRCR
eukprot:Sspe_Gene.91926::Locus_63585_Transcript_1_1_Confidence_1.000_Length_449::g.91926::m.91926